MPNAVELITDQPTLMVVPWEDPVVDRVGYDVRSPYVETFWLGVLGPTALWIARRLVAGFARYPLGYEVDLVELASSLGLSHTRGPSSPFMRSLQRTVMFGVSQPIDGALAMRRRFPPVAQRQLARMPEPVQQSHREWRSSTSAGPAVWERARVLAEAMVEAGDDAELVHRQLVTLGIDASVAERATAHAISRGVAPSAALRHDLLV